MQANITYPEIQKYISGHYAKQVELAYINNSTLRISTEVQVWRLSKTIHVDLTIERITGTDLYISYNGGLSVELVIAPLLSFMKRLIPDKTSFIEETGNHQIIVHLEKIERLNHVFEYVSLQSIGFDEENAIIRLSLKE